MRALGGQPSVGFPPTLPKLLTCLPPKISEPFLIGGKAEADVAAAQEVIAACKSKPISLLGETGIRELVALIDLCSAHLGGDTGSTHIAAALDKPAVGLYSITKPLRSCPYGQFDRCLYEPAGLAQIRPEAVIGVLREALA